MNTVIQFVSQHVGRIGCTFCASTLGGKNLEAGEIVSQGTDSSKVLDETDERVSNRNHGYW